MGSRHCSHAQVLAIYHRVTVLRIEKQQEAKLSVCDCLVKQRLQILSYQAQTL